MQIVVTQEDMKKDLDALTAHIDGLYNLLYDHNRSQIASCHDAMLESMTKVVSGLRKKITTAPRANG